MAAHAILTLDPSQAQARRDALADLLVDAVEGGASVNFVAGPTGPFYEHTMPAHDVLVLMIRKRWK